MGNSITPIVKKILFVNLGVYLVNNILGIDLTRMFALHNVESQYFQAYQIITHLFLHANFMHLLSNMITLCTFGSMLEIAVSSKRLFQLYFFTGIGAALLYLGSLNLSTYEMSSLYHSYLVDPNPTTFDMFMRRYPQIYNNYYGFIYDYLHDATNVAFIEKARAILLHLYSLRIDIPILGASGAVFGILTSFAMLFPNAQIRILLVPFGVKAKYFVILYGLYELYAGMSISDDVAHFAHLGGIVLGYIFTKLFRMF